MKLYIKSHESIFSMATIGIHKKPNFLVAVHPDINRSGDCYFKYYNSDSYQSADRVARLNIKKAATVSHRNRDGKKEWKLNAADKDAICRYLVQQSDKYRSFDMTNWQYILYSWNHEFGLLNEPFPEEYNSHIEAFLDGYYDKMNEGNPSYVASYLDIPNYRDMK